MTFKYFFKSRQGSPKLPVGKANFQVKIKITGMPLDLQNMFQKTLCRKSCYESPTKYRRCDSVCIFEIAGMHLFKGAMESLILLFT